MSTFTLIDDNDAVKLTIPPEYAALRFWDREVSKAGFGPISLD